MCYVRLSIFKISRKNVDYIKSCRLRWPLKRQRCRQSRLANLELRELICSLPSKETMTMQYIEQTITTDPLIDSDRESDKSDDGDSTKLVHHMYVWNEKYLKWHEGVVSFGPPYLQITEYEDLKLEVNERQLQHLNQKWFHGTLSRREARVILQDFGGGNGSFIVRTSESYHGKFAISFVHESRVKHVVIENRRDPVAGMLYHITPNGPFFNSLNELIEEARKRPLIQNHMFDITLTQCPPKPDMSWLHRGVKSLSQAEQILRKEHRDGAFFVYRTNSDYAPYIVAYRSNGSILHNLITVGQRPGSGYTLNNVTSAVLYKIIHYFMENPINEKTVLKYPVADIDTVYTNCGIAIKDYYGDRGVNELNFSVGALITNIQNKTGEWAVGDHRGDKQKYFRPDHVRLLRKDELTYVKDLSLSRYNANNSSDHTDIDFGTTSSHHLSHTVSLNLQTDYQVEFETLDENNTTILIEPSNPMIKTFRSYKLSCPSSEDLETWYQSLQRAKCLPKTLTEKVDRNIKNTSSKKAGCIIS